MSIYQCLCPYIYTTVKYLSPVNQPPFTPSKLKSRTTNPITYHTQLHKRPLSKQVHSFWYSEIDRKTGYPTEGKAKEKMRPVRVDFKPDNLTMSPLTHAVSNRGLTLTLQL